MYPAALESARGAGPGIDGGADRHPFRKFARGTAADRKKIFIIGDIN
jgi:hypothetical protein